MPTLSFHGRRLPIEDGEDVLSCLARHDIPRPFSCRSGVCQTCVMKATDGVPPAASQVGLKHAWKAQNYFLPCVCKPDVDLEIDDCDAMRSQPAYVTDVTHLGRDVIRVEVTPDAPFAFDPGQFVTVERPGDSLSRPYSIASLGPDGPLELHVKVVQDGAMSSWLETAVGQAVLLRGPCGECFYQSGSPQQPLLLAATGTGLAPLLGVLRRALECNHTGPIHLFHGAKNSTDLYLWSSLCQLALRHPQLQLVGTVLKNDNNAPHVQETRLEEAIARALPQLDGFRVYLCGNPKMVARLKKKSFLAGASLQDIHSDAFVTAAKT